jgi:hypothetical protein
MKKKGIITYTKEIAILLKVIFSEEFLEKCLAKARIIKILNISVGCKLKKPRSNQPEVPRIFFPNQSTLKSKIVPKR